MHTVWVKVMQWDMRTWLALSCWASYRSLYAH